jgi:amidohydrolase
MSITLLNYLNTAIPYATQIREHIHTYPELSFAEHNTSQYIQQQLIAMGIYTYTLMADTGIVVTLQGQQPNTHCLAFRAELDALPITEQSTQSYASKHNGVMHACGHDFHTACALACIQVLQLHPNEWQGTVKFIFQPGEEKDPGGASILINEGILKQEPLINNMIALHVYPHLPAGIIGTRAGTYMASADEVYITIKGKGGHAALPHLCIDPIVIAAQVLLGLQQIVSRAGNPIDATVLTFGKIQGGTKGNIIPNEVQLEGTLRCMNEVWRSKCHKLIHQYSQQIAESFGGYAEVKILVGYPCVYNHEGVTEQVNAILQQTMGASALQQLPLRMTADDFAFYSHQIPSNYIRIGTTSADGESYNSGVHTPTFDVHPDAYHTAISVILSLVQHWQIVK